jgi:hypothetical protein
MPPSCLYITIIVGHIPGNCPLGLSPNAAKEADCMDNRVRTMSKGYVKKTDVMPAIPPHTSLSTGLKGAPGELSKKCCTSIVISPLRFCSRRSHALQSHLLIEVITSKLDRRVRDYTDAIRAVPTHEASPTFFTPHLCKGLADWQLIFVTTGALDLIENLEPFKRRHDSPGDGTGNTTSAECSSNRLRYEFSKWSCLWGGRGRLERILRGLQGISGQLLAQKHAKVTTLPQGQQIPPDVKRTVVILTYRGSEMYKETLRRVGGENGPVCRARYIKSTSQYRRSIVDVNSGQVFNSRRNFSLEGFWRLERHGLRWV